MKKQKSKKEFIKFLKKEKEKIDNNVKFINIDDLEPYKYAITETLKIIEKNE